MARFRYGDKDSAREKIVRHASLRFRKEGLAGVGMRPIMADAGLTHGAFYAHFATRADLVEAALDAAMDETLAALAAAADAAPEGRKLEAIIDSYLRPAHRDRTDLGCATAALAPDIAREDVTLRDHYLERVGDLADLIAAHLPAGGSAVQRGARAHILFGTMLGVLQLARIATDAASASALINDGRATALASARLPWPADAE
ncbi:MAG: TetR/AcrR family transcriptional regulator [Sphingopyxis sp.]|nr:TetR/AcrR family transcriptional regulator [Sphingopyxis sp.]